MKFLAESAEDAKEKDAGDKRIEPFGRELRLIGGWLP